jgi:hypothetical protein
MITNGEPTEIEMLYSRNIEAKHSRLSLGNVLNYFLIR